MEVKSLLEMVEESLAKERSIGIKTSTYKDFISNNREHQIKALNAIDLNDRGQIILPTGTGKTRVQVSMIVKDMIAKTQKGINGTYVIASHRLLLNKQLMDELIDLCLKCQLPINALYVGSSRHDDKEIYDKYFHNIVGNLKVDYSTLKSDVEKFAKDTYKDCRHLIVVSTYHSFDKLSSLDAIDICAYDEAHNTVEENFRNNIEQVIAKIKRNYFFTATRKVCSIVGHGMEDESTYGKVIVEVSPTEMINAGEIIRPRVMTLFLDDELSQGIVSTNDQHMLVKTAIESFIRTKNKVKEDSPNPNCIGNKLMISFEGSDELNLVQESSEFQLWCVENNIKVFSFSSKYGFSIDFTKSNRDSTYEAMKNLSDEEDAILLHIDILTEGIDLPSITSILLMRNLNEISLFQTLGRGLRLTRKDRVSFYSNQITKEQFTKPFAYLIFPLHFERMDTSSEDMKKTIQDIVGTYGIPIEEFLPTDSFRARPNVCLDIVTKTNLRVATGKDYPLLSVIEDFIIGEIKKDLPKDPLERYNFLELFFENLDKEDLSEEQVDSNIDKDCIKEILFNRTEWRLDGVLHRINGPAVELNNGNRYWFKNGKKHRLNGPAIEFSNGNRYWYQNDKPHRIDGPAIELSNGNRYWYIEGQKICEEEHQNKLNKNEFSESYEEEECSRQQAM